jgi:ABC-type sugar transport system ATPase subunit
MTTGTRPGSDADPAAPLLAMTGIVKSYPGVRALDGVDLEVAAGEVVALVGENGAGKSTLMKVLGGVVAPDGGRIRLAGRAVAWRSPREARAAGIAVIHQELSLVPGLTASENIFLGQEPTRHGFLAPAVERRRTVDLVARLGAHVDPHVPCGRLTTSQQQLVEIARAISTEARVLVMDEPTASLSHAEAARLHEVIRELRSSGVAVIYISHRLEEIAAVCDRVVVLRDGRNVGGGPAGSLGRRALIALMVGRDLVDEYPARDVVPGPVRLAARGLRRGGAVRDVSFSVRRGEILALAGLVGAGRTETLRLVFGADRREAGTIEVDGRPVTVRSPRDAIAAGIALLTEDRKAEGLVLSHPVRENIALPNLAGLSRAGFIDGRRERALVDRFATELRVRLAHPDVPAATLSGGNQQKVVIAKWLARSSDVLLFDEPTRGIDVGARREIYLLMNELAASGKAIVMASSDLPEVLGMADRILVMHDGRVTGEIANGPDVTPEQVMALAVA